MTTAGAAPVVTELARWLGQRTAPDVAVLSGAGVQETLDAVAAWRPDARVTPLEIGPREPRLHVRMAAAGPFDAVIDLTPRRAERRRDTLRLHLRPGGVWVSRQPGGSLEVVTSSEPAVAVIRDAEAADLVALDPGRGRVVESRPPSRWEVHARVRTSGAMPANPLPDHYEAPALFLREYDDVLCLPRQVAIARNIVLPETFTTVEDHRHRNAALHKLNPHFARRPDYDREPQALPGRWFHLDNHMGWHFGHAVSEQISRLWGWDRAREADPGLKALVTSESGELTSWQRDLFAAGGVPPDDVHVATGPVRVRTLVGCTPMFSRPAYVHRGMVATYDRISSHLSQHASDRPWPAKVFLGRRSTKRACLNADELLAEFVAAGFTVVHPEDHPLADQVELVRRAEVVAGFAGSGMFHVAFAGAPKHVVLVTSESYPAHNEYMMSVLLGHRLDVVLCEPQVPRVDGQFSRESFHSDFVYRPEREGVFLRSVLAEA